MDKQAIGVKIHVIPKSTVTLPTHDLSVMPLTAIHYPKHDTYPYIARDGRKSILHHQTTKHHNNTQIMET